MITRYVKDEIDGLIDNLNTSPSAAISLYFELVASERLVKL